MLYLASDFQKHLPIHNNILCVLINQSESDSETFDG
jgi:hypothetical protein